MAGAALAAHAAANPANDPAKSATDNPWDCRVADGDWICHGSPSGPEQRAPTAAPAPPAAVPLASPDTFSVGE
ncbi:MAG: hypothetical protein M0R02_14985, partial [Bacteroidales bacterium]|nr:hypothetical protein [Bacteroidales bacterium]